MLNHSNEEVEGKNNTVRLVLTATMCFATAEGLKYYNHKWLNKKA